GRWVVAATVLGSGIAFLDSTVVNVALPHIGEDLDTTVAGLQWVLNGYLVTLSSLILLGGALGDLFGRKRVFQTGVVLFALASVACALAPNDTALVVGRVAQGIGGALLTPARGGGRGGRGGGGGGAGPGEPGHPRGELQARGPTPGYRRVVRPVGRGRGRGPLRRRLAGRRRAGALGLLLP